MRSKNEDKHLSIFKALFYEFTFPDSASAINYAKGRPVRIKKLFRENSTSLFIPDDRISSSFPLIWNPLRMQIMFIDLETPAPVIISSVPSHMHIKPAFRRS